ncbi:histidine--tRNA ligase [Kyrpidia tusciae]|uniref:Histidine--tRNA ligase n=1 Tax=Kyrpidia tusciae (strain DSM 2912 / NBRC 15312 / T2) TaxID=562970 RepID=D5WWX7_KYRT2|nr:histidine--tRNA ligase [Kyrpidia tusciae]ADG05828.1 histidyl-tRNA synthetase [Kyrpidia tusciae DSM 2912]
MLTQRPRGMHDILPQEASLWHEIEEAARRICARYGFSEVRTPILEHTELFQRGVGENTDIVEKEMYTFNDRGGRSMTLRPEGTAGAVRAYVEHKFYGGPQPIKWFYLGPMFRYERPQAGRQRQFHQFGVEVFGVADPAVDAEVIALGLDFLEDIGLEGLRLELNSVGCPQCRPMYRERLQAYYRPLREQLCEDCRDRLERNPLRLLDCKRETCKALAERAPRIEEALCEECRAHDEGVHRHLEAAGIAYEINPRLVRGLDYYTRTAFEVVEDGIGAQGTVLGGGRYNGLVEELGGPSVPGIGFAAGLERLILALEQRRGEGTSETGVDVFGIALGDEASVELTGWLRRLRALGCRAERGFEGKSLKAQLKAADRLGARWALILGEEERRRGVVMVKDLAGGEQRELPVLEVESWWKETEHGTGR